MRHPDDKGVGGYFSLERATARPARPTPWPADALRVQSARAAITAVMRASGSRHVWVPHFICGAVRDALSAAGVVARPYPLSDLRGVPEDLPVDDADWVLCVDYFGQSARACDQAIARFGPRRVLVDASQALFHRARPGASTVYSPRKFSGVPDGGILVTPLRVAPPALADEPASLHRTRHLHSRAAGNVAQGYLQYQEAERSLKDCRPQAMSRTTRGILDKIDWHEVADRRTGNHRILADALAQAGIEVHALPAGSVPLCCAVPCKRAVDLREKLASEGVFTAMYWPDADVPGGDRVGQALRDSTLYLPCDQRYDAADMLDLSRVLLRHWGDQ
ncbi:hypothetical protein [Arenimonas sp. MALMAid1274]|uniref:hypothetical protein n=1 Tax=Arenimonas sp. MALMAid1274 TaxID=3411630 RepID=UPI003BA31B9A